MPNRSSKFSEDSDENGNVLPLNALPFNQRLKDTFPFDLKGYARLRHPSRRGLLVEDFYSVPLDRPMEMAVHRLRHDLLRFFGADRKVVHVELFRGTEERLDEQKRIDSIDVITALIVRTR